MIVIVDYEAGNLASVYRAVESLGFKAKISSDPEEIVAATKVIFPGVGAAGQAMSSLKERGLDEALQEVVVQGKGMLGICLGSQIILEKSEENDTLCLSLLPGCTRKLPSRASLKIPHMGWNQVNQIVQHPLFKAIPDKSDFYFVHSYYNDVPSELILGSTEYGISFPSVIGKDSVFAVQFHTEKSGKWGVQLLKNFLCMEF
ncbi:MAG: imidazole glycerol phosphate synthase subunit HisH [bacterium]